MKAVMPIRKRAIIVGLTLAIGLAAAAANAAAAAQSADPPVTDQSILSALKIGPVPTELVFLVDLSDSMSGNAYPPGPYPLVQSVLPDYLSALATQAPKDQVVVITFGNPGTATPIYGPGAPTANIGLPPDAHEGTTDFGQAFAKALDQFSPPPAGIKAGGVVLLSDGTADEADDPAYQGNSGWQTLQERARSISKTIPITAYAVALTPSSGDYIQAQKASLEMVFDPVETLPGASNLSGALTQAVSHVRDGEVASAVALDSGKGVQVSWSGLPTNSHPLNFGSAGEIHTELILEARTARVPLSLAGLRFTTTSGLPVTMTAPADQSGTVTLYPGKPVQVPVTLSWPKKPANWSGSGNITLTAAVGSPWAAHLPDFYVNNFSAGTLHGVTSFHLTALSPPPDMLPYLIFIVIIVLAIVACFVLAFLARLRGTLTVALVDQPRNPGYYRLPPLPLATTDIQRLVGVQGKMTVRRSWRGMKVTVTRSTLSGTVNLRPGGRIQAGGLEIAHVNGGR